MKKFRKVCLDHYCIVSWATAQKQNRPQYFSDLASEKGKGCHPLIVRNNQLTHGRLSALIPDTLFCRWILPLACRQKCLLYILLKALDSMNLQ